MRHRVASELARKEAKSDLLEIVTSSPGGFRILTLFAPSAHLVILGRTSF